MLFVISYWLLVFMVAGLIACLLKPLLYRIAKNYFEEEED